MKRWVFLDFDGVIIDSEGISLRSWRSLFAGEKELSLADICGNSAVENARRLFPELVDNQDIENIVSEKVSRDHAQLEGGRYPLVSQATETVINLSGQYDLAIVSSNSSSTVNDHLAHYDLSDYIRRVVCANDELRRKPAPDLYFEALGACETRREDAVAIEDSPAGIAAANAAGVAVIGFGQAVEHSPIQTGWLSSFDDQRRVAGSLKQAFN